jgi:hypothetical protein
MDKIISSLKLCDCDCVCEIMRQKWLLPNELDAECGAESEA